MFKTVRKKLNKKGFTLAELLVVVAIIAILVAIAIPIFTGQLDGAQRAVNQANARSIKGIAASEVLAEWDTLGSAANRTNKTKPGWIAAGHVTATGDIDEIHVYIADSEQIAGNWVVSDDENPLKNDDAGKYAHAFTGSTAKAVDETTATDKAPHWIVVTIDDINQTVIGS